MAKRKAKIAATPLVPKGEVEVVVFEEPRKKKKIEQKMETKSSSADFDFNRARHDVFKFGLTGMEETHQKDAKIAYAVRLGAKPPKNKYINYKELMEEKRKEKEDLKLARLERGHDRFSSAALSGKKFVNKKDINKKKMPHDVPKNLDYQVGKFKKGVQIVKHLPRR